MGIIDDGKLQNILPKYSELKLSGINLAQQYVSAFNTGMNIYQCINQLQGYIEWVIKAVNDVVVQWNEIVDSQLQDSINATKQATTEQFNIEWAKNKAQLDTEIEGIIQEQFNVDWQVREDAINLKITGVSNDLAIFKTETDTKFTNTKEEFTQLNNTTKQELTNLINTTIDNTINSIYPIGSVYTTLTETNPGTFLRGTWEQFAQGRTLIGVGEGNDGATSMTFESDTVGGEYNHKLTTDEMPKHSHYISGYSSSFGTEYYYNLVGGSNNYGSKSTSESGGDVAHNNVQPYATVYFWKRLN
jgi:hypothetical protein